MEAYWRSLKHQWLFLNTLDTVARVRALVEFHVTEHNTKMPHAALRGQTPDEMFFGIAAKVPEELALAKTNARQRAWPPTGRFPASAVSSSKPACRHSTFFSDFHAADVANNKFKMSSHAAPMNSRTVPDACVSFRSSLEPP